MIAVDGPAAAGKGTLARRLADRYGLRHLDSGLLYRAVGMRVLRAGGDPADVAAAAVAAARSLAESDLAAPDLRGAEAGQAASVVAVIPEVRAALLDYLRAFGRRPPGAVIDGRDIGTVVFPDADHKLFVTADLDARARRRAAEIGGPVDAVRRDLAVRDARDAGRAVAPLTPATDAFILDTSNLDIDDAFAAAVAAIEASGSRGIGCGGNEAAL